MNNWKIEFADKHFRLKFVSALAVLLISIITLGQFLQMVELRAGVAFADPLLKYLTPCDLSVPAFALVYGVVALTLLALKNNPQKVLIGLISYIILVWVRMGAMYLLPLEPPGGMIPLADPMAEIFATGGIMTKDLFFSGHTATCFMMYLLTKGTKYGKFILACAIGVAVCVLIQHVHYSIDVFAAPFFAWSALSIGEKIEAKS